MTSETASREWLLEKIVPAMALAPSAHNTQPWQFKVSSDVIDIFINWHRHLTISDPAQRELYVSLGCAIENAVVAAQHFGYHVASAYFPDGKSAGVPVTRLRFSVASDKERGAVNQGFKAITTRRTNRAFYDAQALTPAELLVFQATQVPGVLLVEDRATISRIAELAAQGTYQTLARADFKAELAQWVRSDWTKRPDGMTGYAMGIPAPLSLVSNWLVRLTPIHTQEGPKAKRQLESAAAVVVIVTEHDEPTAWLDAGQLLERIWLAATSLGLAAMPMAAAIEASDEIRQRLQQVLATKLLPQAILRVGHSQQKKLRATPRRTVADCLI